jgi:hypothetical protein
VEASNSYARTLTFGSFFFIAFLSSFFRAPFYFFDLAFYCIFSFSDLVFYRPLFPPFFFVLVLSLFFLAYAVSSLAYPNLLGNKMIGCYCCYCIKLTTSHPVVAQSSTGQRLGLQVG